MCILLIAQPSNETCCREEGVPEECMGLCTETGRKSGTPSQCDTYENRIVTCITSLLPKGNIKLVVMNKKGNQKILI